MNAIKERYVVDEKGNRISADDPLGLLHFLPKADLYQPGPDASGPHPDGDGTCCVERGALDHVVAGRGARDFLIGRAPSELPWPDRAQVRSERGYPGHSGSKNE